MRDNLLCPCGTGQTYKECCQAIHNGQRLALTAEQLMRSRYTAFALKNESYLLNSWHIETKPSSIPFEKHVKWIGLKIRSKEDGTQDHTSGTVSFVARYKIDGKAFKLEENSQFFKIHDIWYYHSALSS